MAICTIAAPKKAIKVEYGSTSMIIDLNESPKVVYENSNMVVRTNTASISVSLPCKITFTDGSSTDIKEIVTLRNDNEGEPLNVFALDGRKIATLKDKTQLLSLKKGIYIVNGKKIIIK